MTVSLRRNQLANLALRLGTMAGRFVLLFAIARFLPPSQVGLYGLLWVTISYGVMVVGLDFYTFTTRELLSRPRGHWPKLLRDQAVMIACTYTALLPLCALLFIYQLLPWEVAGWFFALLVTEHLTRELNRLIVVVGRPVLANAIGFLQKGSWSFVVPGFMLVSEELRSLNFLLAAWAISSFLAVLTGLWAVRDLRWQGLEASVDWSWLRSGLRIAGVFFCGTLLLQGMFTVDRYLVGYVGSLDLVGVYTLFVGISMGVMSFLEAGVFSFRYPSVVKSYRDGELTEFWESMRVLARDTVLVSTGLLIILAFGMRVVLPVIQRPLYEQHLMAFDVLLLAVGIYGLSMVPHYGLYAMGRDLSIVTSHGIGLAVFVVCGVIGALVSPVTGVATGLLAGCTAMACVKGWLWMENRPGREGG